MIGPSPDLGGNVTAMSQCSSHSCGPGGGVASCPVQPQAFSQYGGLSVAPGTPPPLCPPPCGCDGNGSAPGSAQRGFAGGGLPREAGF